MESSALKLHLHCKAEANNRRKIFYKWYPSLKTPPAGCSHQPLPSSTLITETLLEWLLQQESSSSSRQKKATKATMGVACIWWVHTFKTQGQTTGIFLYCSLSYSLDRASHRVRSSLLRLGWSRSSWIWLSPSPGLGYWSMQSCPYFF